MPATEALADIYVNAIAGTVDAALAILHDLDAARDVAHDVFLGVWLSGRWPIVKHPLAYLEAASRREAIRRVERASNMGISLKGVERQITLGRLRLRDCLRAGLG